MNAPHDLPRSARHDDEEDLNTSGNPTFQAVLDARLSRRSILRGGVGGAAAAVLGSWSLTACGGGGIPLLKLGFDAVPKSTADVVTVPPGYTARVLYAMGDPLDMATPPFRNDGSDTGFEMRAGDHHDGMFWFGLTASGKPDPESSQRGLLAMNHEALTDHFLHVAGSSARPRPAAESDKEMPAHGISIVEVMRKGKGYAYVRNSPHNRRITPLTPVVPSPKVTAPTLLSSSLSQPSLTTR